MKDESFGIIPLSKESGEWKVLLIHHQSGNHWGFPKGHKNGLESDYDAACRELKEETGLDIVQCVSNMPFTETFTFRRSGTLIEKTVSYFPAVVGGEVAIQLEEIRQALWFSFPDALKRLTFEEARSICRQVRQILDHIIPSA
jgi:bis(5'-nucleosidyl)-tetraphosphatase